jgi:hypothetical protein
MQEHAPQGQRYRDRAEQCRRVARTAPAHLKEKYLLLAESYDALAKYEEGGSLHRENDKPI